MGWQDELYNPKEGTVLGRTFGSWVRILAFYAVYYTFLFCLFYAFTIYWYQGTLPEAGSGTRPYIGTRLDQPGCQVYPLKQLQDYKEGPHPKKISIKMGGDSKLNHYVSSAEYNAELYSHLQAKVGQFDCKTQQSAQDAKGKQSNCQVPDGPTKQQIDNQMQAHKPMVSFEVNRIIGWKPINNHPIRFTCTAFNVKEGVEAADKADWKFESALVESTIPSYYYPFLGQSEDEAVKKEYGYTKPYVAFYISYKNGKAWTKGEYHNFRCNVIADNISQLSGKKQPTAADADLIKLAVGVVEFGIKFI